MRITMSNDIPDRDTFFTLFETTGWNEEYRLDADQLYTALQHSWTSVSAYDGNRLAGFGRVVSDGILHALIVDLIVQPEYQGQSIGSTLLRELVARCRGAGIRDIQLFCAPGQAGFYEEHGFQVRPEEAPGMQLPVLP
ncbi:MAG: GNAT family N-acetyltransferase [Fidelibacterota bacterium]|nr:MAG: GNAT family N-acetyltransferase [Candidatus Neomarinimicrobiota bacterium]